MFFLPLIEQTSIYLIVYLFIIFPKTNAMSLINETTDENLSTQTASYISKSSKPKESLNKYLKILSKSPNRISSIQNLPNDDEVTNATNSSMTSSNFRTYNNTFAQSEIGYNPDPFQTFDVDPNNALRTYVNAFSILGTVK